ncbi:uncharacterized protein TrAtP1_000236 [Trichoderma atroviride]|uniref:AA1-like domain-containing protein n=1 Tax=Hypocrea atroviridis (strain ATCC 20476 / IMI 206040) TaxID=452589 RepID=G9NJU0_HYPAI|nr:uncharacterized protein TRIATDRAFT_297835 [Trichoderma atroviride IMI 206040]EHK49163.1 hypothetical protein TRIATDRAFT_297835 [Trichoderma atroviride IMI 206040]UKZ58914.1 hypothetical protein TrAtP1_000236 [Trichoderma atroviride]
MLSLLSTLLLVGSALALPSRVVPRDADTSYPPPPATTATGCTASSTKVSKWTVDDFDFHASYTFSTPAHQNSWGYVNFTLSNPALGYTPVCSAASDQLSDFFYGNFVYNCEVPASAAADKATFTFARPTNSLAINQTWHCADEGSRFTAQGGVQLNLTCSDTTWQNPNWQPGQIYSQRTVTCGKVTAPATIEEMSAVL